MASRALVIGLDCAPPELVFERWRDELPVLRGLMKQGTYGVLRSCDPPITVPAWTSMTSSRSPGTLGIYGFRNRRSRSYDDLAFADSRAVCVPRVWDLLSARGRSVIVIGVPQTYPVNEVNGVMVACFLTPNTRTSPYTHPTELRDEIHDLVGDYMPDVPDFRTDDKERLRADIEDVTEKRFRVAEHLLATRPWDLFFMVEMGTDRIQHGFRRFFDPLHRLYEVDNRFEHVALDYYRALDERIGRLLRFADDDTAVLVVSDHGAKRREGAICVNEWLRQEGYLTLKREPAQATRLNADLVDWERTAAWGEGGHYCRLFLNVAGREPQGVVRPADYDRVREDLQTRLEALGDDRGRPLATVAHRPEDLYPESNGVAPDLLVYFGDLYWRSNGQVGTDSLHVFENDTGPDDANHAHEGVYVLAADGVRPGAGPERDLRDIAPTLLALLGEPIPQEMEGSPLV
jgi:predicted AlkP superfamily phosphohydrolase/phosphomutase